VCVAVAPAERTNECNIERHLPRLEIGERTPIGKDGIGRDQHLKLVGKTTAIAQHRNVARLVRGCRRAAQFLDPCGGRGAAGDGVGHVTQGSDQRRVIARHGFVILPACLDVAARDPATVENGKRQGCTTICDRRAAFQQLPQPQRLQADQRRQVHVGVEVRTRHFDPLCRGVGTQPCGNDVRPPSDERNPRLARDRGADWPQDRAGDGKPSIGTGTQQGGDAVTRQKDRLVDSGNIGPGDRNARLRLAEAAARVDTDRHTLGGQLRGRLADLQRIDRDIARPVQLCEVGIGRRDIRSQQQPCLRRIDARSLCLRRRSSKGSAVSSPKIEVERRRRGKSARILNAVGHELRRNAQILALLHAACAALRIERGQERRPRLACQPFGGANACCGDRNVGRSSQCLVHERIERRIVIGLPPAIDRPRLPSSRNRLGRRERRGTADHRRGAQIGNLRTGREAEHGGNCGHMAEGHWQTVILSGITPFVPPL